MKKSKLMLEMEKAIKPLKEHTAALKEITKKAKSTSSLDPYWSDITKITLIKDEKIRNKGLELMKALQKSESLDERIKAQIALTKFLKQYCDWDLEF